MTPRIGYGHAQVLGISINTTMKNHRIWRAVGTIFAMSWPWVNA